MFVFPKRGKSLLMGLIRTTPFVAAGALSLLLFYQQANWQFNTIRDASLLIIFALLCWTVFFAVSQQLPYSKKNIIDDLLLSSFFMLGIKYRINIMELRSSKENAFESYFAITYSHGYTDPSIFKEKIKMSVPGASNAYEDGKTKYITKPELRSEIDPDVKHIWSAPIKDKRGHTVAVINIDNIVDENINEDEVKLTSKSAEQLADIIGYYWEIPT